MYRPHIKLAHQYWNHHVCQGDIVIDATCGNGYDTAFLAKLKPAKLYAIDLQLEAITATRHLMEQTLSAEEIKPLRLIQSSHVEFPQEILPGSVKLIVYNLGYLPSGDKSKKTQAASTLQSLQNALSLISEGGMISMTFYPGHDGGDVEEQEVLAFASQLDRKQWNCCYHQWINRPKSPTLLIIKAMHAMEQRRLINEL